jgi:two-component system, cell cycle sensor histidine kinase and response regulator CckA
MQARMSEPSDFDRDHLAAIVSSSEDAIVSKFLDGTIRTWNAAAERIFGYTAEEMIGSSIFRLIPPELHDEERHILNEIRQGHRISHYETQRVHKNGSRVIISLTISPVRDAAGNLIGAAAVKRDITVQRNLEEQLRQAQKMEALGQLAGGVAHDFNNILTIISGFAAFLGRSIPEDSPAYPDLLGIEQATERATQLTQQLLAFARHQTPHIEVLDLAVVVNEVATMLRRLLGDHIRLQVRPTAAPVWVRADRGQMSQVLINLAVNARDAMAEGGTLTIGLHDEPRTNTVVLTVRDTGHGMDQETQGRLFDRFFTTKPVGQGTGLGLTTVAGIVRGAGGRIEVESEPGQGALFRITLPRAVRDSSAADAQREDELQGHETVLVVDDESGVAQLAARILLDYGYTVLQATGAGAAMLAFAQRATPVDLVVTDIVMPGLNGRALVDQLRVHEPGLKALYITGHADKVLSDPQHHAADAPVITKPFTPVQLATAVRQALNAPPAEERHTNGDTHNGGKVNGGAH